MKSLLFVSLLAFAAAGFLELEPVQTNIGNNCNTTQNAFNVETFGIEPWPLARDENAAMNLAGTFTTAETLGALVVNVDFSGVPFYQLALPRNGTFTKGTSYKDGYGAYFPSIAPSGNYVVKLQLRNAAGAYLNCWQVNFSL